MAVGDDSSQQNQYAGRNKVPAATRKEQQFQGDYCGRTISLRGGTTWYVYIHMKENDRPALLSRFWLVKKMKD